VASAGAAEPPFTEPAPASGPPTSIVPLQATPTPLPDSPQAAPSPPAIATFDTFEDGEGRIALIPRDGGESCRAGAARLDQDLRSVIFLDPAAAEDCYGPAQRRIETYTGWGDDREPDRCVGPQAACAALADALRLSKHRSRAVFRSDGWVDVIVVSKGDPALAAAPLRYTVVLHTTQAHLTVDLRAMTSMLNDMAAP